MSIDVGALASRHNDPSTSKLVDILSAAVNTQTSSPSQLAAALDGLYTPDQDAESLLWTLWTLYIDVARQVPAADDARQTLLVSAVQELKKHTRGTVEAWGGQAALWADLPFFGPCMREAWNDGPKYDGSEADGEAIQRWISINAFAARLFDAGVVPSWDNFAVWALRDSLETESANADVSVSVASKWLEHAGGVLRDKSSAADAASLDEAAKRVLRPGKLFDGESGLNQGRWAFWQDRLVTLAGQVKDPAVKARADRVIALVKS